MDIDDSASTPSLAPESLASDETNTLILASLSPTFFEPTVLDALKDHFSSYGHIHSWAPLKGFGRIIIVFWRVEDADIVKVECDGMVLADDDGKIISAPLRVYRGTHTVLDAETDHLPVPHIRNNFLISPPGSPPVGWEQVEEDAPNSAPLAEDIIAALHRLQMNQARQKGPVQILMTPDDDNDENVEQPDKSAPDSASSSQVQPTSIKGPGLSVYLEDVDYKEDDEEFADGTVTPQELGVYQGEQMRGGIGMVKATVASMMQPPPMSGGLSTPGSGKIARVPTPRPPTEPLA
ncbi:carbohydrate-binding module 1 protein [Tulasnella sp. 419]|nr:carbohydrate-binding module 1 protein [Tulasnella sp. 418]KAG8968007.1 carbohydrate-binding module 1 protein [Tulasnella sp. 419]